MTPVILDTYISVTLLETTVYDKVKQELQKIGELIKDDENDDELEVCYNNSPEIKWPDLIFSFPASPSTSSKTPQMVLTSHNYVVKVRTGVKCAAIFRTVDVSVIGSMAQLDQEMVFDLSGPTLYFGRQLASGPAGGPLAVESPNESPGEPMPSETSRDAKPESAFHMVTLSSITILFSYAVASWLRSISAAMFKPGLPPRLIALAHHPQLSFISCLLIFFLYFNSTKYALVFVSYLRCYVF